MEGNNPGERTVPVQFIRGTRAFKQFKNPPQPHMCIQDSIKNTCEKVYINVLGWQKIANPKNGTDPIPLYGGMQVPQGCGPNSNKPPLIVFAVMVHPEILRVNGKHAPNPYDREGLVKVLSDFVEAMNPTLQLERQPVLLQDRDLAGELKDVWLAVQAKREREKGASRDVSYKVYDIDGPRDLETPFHTSEDIFLEMLISDGPDNSSQQNLQSYTQKSSKQILKNAGQKSEFDSGMNNYQLSQNTSSYRNLSCERREQISSHGSAASYGEPGHTTCTPVYTQLVSPRENRTQAGDIHQAYAMMENAKQDNGFRKDLSSENRNRAGPSGWGKFSKCDLPESSQNGSSKYWTENKNSNLSSNGTSDKKESYNFYPTFEKTTQFEESHSVTSAKLIEHGSQGSSVKTNTEVQMSTKSAHSHTSSLEKSSECSEIFLDNMQKLTLCSTEEKCDKQEIYNSGITS